MRTKILFSIIGLCLMINAFGQKSTLELSFEAKNNGQTVPIDSILIENLTQGTDTILYSPDTLLILDYISSINELEPGTETDFSLTQNYPNPFKDKTMFSLYLSKREFIKINIRNILGKELANYDNTLNSGKHNFSFYASNETFYLLTVSTKNSTKTIKLSQIGANYHNEVRSKLVYNNFEEDQIGFKSTKDVQSFLYSVGDQLRYIGYSNTIVDVKGSDVIKDSPLISSTYEFNITEGIPCPETPTVNYEGNIYNTVQIGGQCWLKENLNVGTKIDGASDQLDNNVIEKYCYDDHESNCDTYGGLYQWNEVMAYSLSEGAQGICPQGWHIPTDEEWKILEGTVDTMYPVGDQEWDKVNEDRGFNAGLFLKSNNGWPSGSNGENLYGFGALPSGHRTRYGTGFNNMEESGFFWTSTKNTSIGSYFRDVMFYHNKIFRASGFDTLGFPVRCIKD